MPWPFARQTRTPGIRSCLFCTAIATTQILIKDRFECWTCRDHLDNGLDLYLSRQEKLTIIANAMNAAKESS